MEIARRWFLPRFDSLAITSPYRSIIYMQGIKSEGFGSGIITSNGILLHSLSLLAL